MKIQTDGGASLSLKSKQNHVAFNPVADIVGDLDIVAVSEPLAKVPATAKKLLNTPGEFEVSGILAAGFFTDDRENVVYKTVFDDLSIVHFGQLKEVPPSDFFAKLGENVDVAVLTLSADFDDKKAKSLIDKLDPRMVMVLGEKEFFPKMVENTGAKMAESNPMNVTKSSLSDDKTDVIILNV